jgi:hypothetical protein
MIFVGRDFSHDINCTEAERLQPPKYPSSNFSVASQRPNSATQPFSDESSTRSAAHSLVDAVAACMLNPLIR